MESPSEPVPTAAPRRRFAERSARRRVLVGVLVALVVGALLWSAAWFYVPPIVAAEARQASERLLGRRLTLGRVTFQPWTLELTAQALAIAGPRADAPPLLAVERIHADLAITSLVRLAPVVDRLEIDAPMLRVARTGDGQSDVDDVLQRLAAQPSSPEPARFALHNIVVRGGGADFDDRPLATKHRLRDLALAVPFISSLPSEREIKVEPHLAFSLDGSRFDSAGARRRSPSAATARCACKLEASPSRRTSATCRAACRRSCARRRSTPTSSSPSSSGRSSRSRSPAPSARRHRGRRCRGARALQVGNVKVQIDELRPLERLRAAEARRDRRAARLRRARRCRATSTCCSRRKAAAAGRVAGRRVPLPTSAASRRRQRVRGKAAARSQRRALATAACRRGAFSVAALALRAGRLDWSDATTAPSGRARARRRSPSTPQTIGWPMAAPVVFRGSAVLGSRQPSAASSRSPARATPRERRSTSRSRRCRSRRSRPTCARCSRRRSPAKLSADLDVDWRAGATAACASPRAGSRWRRSCSATPGRPKRRPRRSRPATRASTARRAASRSRGSRSGRRACSSRATRPDAGASSAGARQLRPPRRSRVARRR